ncbi:MAG: phenylacetic acid degradation operon negative regulatory protein PaaX [Candidatus Eremiobacteraeota bacterium]|nr:phenylacetic acid degradation operon negative regulatory protein PaaX [Candidatus Eremiobacteraeota bacterium]
MIFTLYGDFVHAHGDELALASLIKLMARCGVSEPAVRQATSRLSHQGWLRARKAGTRSFYALTARGVRRIQKIAPRIYEASGEWDGHWRLLTYTVAEGLREARDRLRKDLAVLGFAPLSASTWLSPREALEAAREAARAHGLETCIDLFEGDHRGPMSDRELLRKCWDVDAIADAYAEFIDAYRPKLQSERRRPLLSDTQAFVERVWLVQGFRRFAYIDPGIPSTLLPPHWPGTVAGAMFRAYYAIISQRATRFFEATVG